MRISRRLRGLLAGAAAMAAVIGAVSLTVPAQAGQIRDYYDGQKPQRLLDEQPSWAARDQEQRYDRDERDRWIREREDRLLAPAPYDHMRDGGPPPWDDTRWGVTR